MSRSFTWAELEWMQFCARRGIGLTRCAAAMGRDYRVVMRRARAAQLSFQRARHSGGRTRHPDQAVRSERARHAALSRWREAA